MIGKVVRPGKGFRGLINYLLLGDKDDPDPSRVAWVELHNLLAKDPLLVPAVMRATASKSERVKVPVYHYVISWHANEAPSEDVMRQVARTTCDDIGLADYQKLFVAHHDKSHRHVHIVVNRIHPETGVAWRTSKDYAKIELSLRRQSEDMGLALVPGKHSDPKRKPQTRRAKTGELQKARREGRGDPRPHWSRDKIAANRESLRDIFAAAHDWSDLCRALVARDLSLEFKGQGLVIADADGTMKLSSLGKDIRLKALEDRFGEAFDPARHMPDEHRDLRPASHRAQHDLASPDRTTSPTKDHATDARSRHAPHSTSVDGRDDTTPHSTQGDDDELPQTDTEPPSSRRRSPEKGDTAEHKPRQFARVPNAALDYLDADTRHLLFLTLDTTTSWQQLSTDLLLLGFSLANTKGRPAIAFSNFSYRFSDFHRTLTLRTLEDKFGQDWEQYAASQPQLADEPEPSAPEAAARIRPTTTTLQPNVLEAQAHAREIAKEHAAESPPRRQALSLFDRLIIDLFSSKTAAKRPLITERDIIFAFRGMGLITTREMRNSLERLAREREAERNPLIKSPNRGRDR